MYSKCFELFSCDSVWKIRFDANKCERFAVIGKFNRFLALTTRFHAQSLRHLQKNGHETVPSEYYAYQLRQTKKLTFFHITNFAVSARVHKYVSNKQTNTQLNQSQVYRLGVPHNRFILL